MNTLNMLVHSEFGMEGPSTFCIPTGILTWMNLFMISQIGAIYRREGAIFVIALVGTVIRMCTKMDSKFWSADGSMFASWKATSIRPFSCVSTNIVRSEEFEPANLWSSLGHSNGRSFVWIRRIWLFRAEVSFALYSQSSSGQGNGRLSVCWASSCVFRFPATLQAYSQSVFSHLNGLSFECVNECLLRSFNVLKALVQFWKEHLNGLSFEGVNECVLATDLPCFCWYVAK